MAQSVRNNGSSDAGAMARQQIRKRGSKSESVKPGRPILQPVLQAVRLPSVFDLALSVMI